MQLVITVVQLFVQRCCHGLLRVRSLSNGQLTQVMAEWLLSESPLGVSECRYFSENVCAGRFNHEVKSSNPV